MRRSARSPRGITRWTWPLIATAGLVLGCERPVEPIAPDHPVLGAWKLTSKDGTCTEIYRFRADRTVTVTSGEEVAEVRSTLSAAPDPEGFYRWDHTVVKHNGQKDCAGNVTNVGHSDTGFILLGRARDRLIFCQKPSTAACFGPLERMS